MRPAQVPASNSTARKRDAMSLSKGHDTETLAEVRLTDAEVESHVCCLKRRLCTDDHFHQRDVERILAARIAQARAGEPWSACTGAGDCPEEWHEHGCYADKGQCSDPTDHHGYPEARAGEGALREAQAKAWDEAVREVGRRRNHPFPLVATQDANPYRLALAGTDRP